MMMCEYVRRDRVFVLRARRVLFFSVCGQERTDVVLDMVLSASFSKPKFYLSFGAACKEKNSKKDQAEAKSTRQKRKKERKRRL